MSFRRSALVAITAAALALATADARAQARRVVIRAPSRSLSLACTAALGGHTFSFNEDAWYTQARASLRDPVNFGPTGTVRIEFVFGPPFDALRPEVLDGADLLVLNPYSPMPQTEELRAFGAYARQGVGFVSFQNAAATFFASAGRCVGENQATFASAAGNPALQGPFGTVSSPYFTGYNCAFTMLDPMARALSSNSAGPNGIMIDLSASIPRAGRAVSFGDEEHFGSLSIPGCGSGGLMRGNNNDTLLRNVFAWVGETAHDPIPSSVEGMMDTDRDGITDDLDGDTDNDGVLDGFEAGDLDPATPPIDTDRDGTPDYKDDDSDNDGIVDTAEHGGSIYDPLVDTDNDGLPDARDLDSDNDGLPDAREAPGDANNNGVPNVRDRDSDSDGLIDGMDVCPTVEDPEQQDRDRDGVGDRCDNCPTIANNNQADSNNNGVGDVCEGSDAGADANAATDSATATDAALSDGTSAPDASAADAARADGGSVEPRAAAGCGCKVSTHTQSRTRDASWWIALVALGYVARRTRRIPRSR
ncbi:MAG: thrombospondin type 3 repeat-containing protein [Polyangiales bacterium]